ncbi:hypothetical protein [Botrimarina hoheduenensis]|uniref:Uncharacterized protein n=1 Tax=Botrimarina hoheduenensis TaxID=2528000 RepID=A0A5C5WF40_9BACT|nr:hypothetical protein [Botrimarina hoheduenensis]TWT48721.1 hypothetical protein Pla111_04960 [Botrimarina hoheduenensis]
MNRYASLSDDFYLNMNLNTEMELSRSRETILHFAEQMQKRYPEMKNFYARDKNDFVLEEDKDRGAYRWCSIEPRRVASGFVNPDSIESALEQHRRALELAPYELSVSPLDCEALDLLVGFDFSCRANHNEVVAGALGVPPAFEKFASMPGATFINNEPTLTISLDEDCRTQVRLAIETRTSPYHIRTGEYQEEQLSAYVTARRYGSLEAGMTYVEAIDELAKLCFEALDNYVIEAVLEPLARTIALDG